MQFKLFTLAAIFATAALAAPAPEANSPPPKPAKPSPPSGPVVIQTNQCGNGATPYCCNTDNKGQYTTCKSMSSGSTCGSTTVCCNAQNSIQLCLGGATIQL